MKIFLKILTVVTTIVYPLFFNLLGGSCIAAGALKTDGFSFMFFTGVAMVVSSVLMTSATVLVLGDKKKAAFITDTAGTVLCVASAAIIVITAQSRGLTDRELRPLSLVYSVRHFPTVLHYAAVMVLFLTDYISRRKEEARELHEFVYSNSGLDEVMHFPDDDI